MIIIMGCIFVDPARADEFRARMKEYAGTDHSQLKALRYQMLIDPDDASKLYVYEEWPDRESFDEWAASEAHARDYAAFADLIVGRDVLVYEAELKTHKTSLPH